MATLAVKTDPRVADVTVTDERLEVTLKDGRMVSAPLAWFPRLANAEPKARQTWEPAAAHARLAAAGVDVSEVRDGRKPGTRVFTVRSGAPAAPFLMIQPSGREST